MSLAFPASPTVGQIFNNWIWNGSAWDAYAAGPTALPRGYVSGMTLANDGTTPNTVLDISAGAWRDLTNTVNIVLASTLAKSISSAWTAGNAGGMGAGLSVAASTWYHVFAIINAGATDVYFDTSASAANAPAGTTASRRIGSFRTNASSQITPFTQNGDEFLWKTPIADYSGAIAAGASNRTLTVPTGVEVWAKITTFMLYNTAACVALLYVLDMGAQVANGAAGYLNLNAPVAGAFTTSDFTFRTNTLAQIGSSATSAGANLFLTTYGWLDRRGKDN